MSFDKSVPTSVAKYRHVTPFRQLLNLVGCLLVIAAYFTITVHSSYPVTLDTLFAIILTEITRYINEGRRMAFYAAQEGAPLRKGLWTEKKDDLEMQLVPRRLDCIAAVVGYREDPELFTRALESYKTARGLVFLLVGIDGDGTEDEDMVSVFNQVYPEQSHVLHIPEPLGEVAQRVRAKEMSRQLQNGQSPNEQECNEVAMRHCIRLARTTLNQENLLIGGRDGITTLCIRQRHMHKKGIMFSTFVFSLLIADMLGVEFLWSSDSDTLVFPDSLERTINVVAGDPTAGGASSGLIVHNPDQSIVTSLAATVYWSELYLTRSAPACTGTSDCQSGPSSAFRLSALSSILLPWYLQKVLGKRMIVNEDRHLTTNLLLRGWRVLYASDVLTATETPATFSRWLRQQIRWARATHIESLLIPRVYTITHPLFFHSAVKREVGPLVVAVAVLVYLLSGRHLLYISYADLALRVGITAGYNVLRNSHRLRGIGWGWAVPGMFFYQMPLPAVQIWSLLTLTADTWGTTMRASGEVARRDGVRREWFETGFFVVWMGIVGATVGRWAATVIGLSWAELILVVVGGGLVAAFAAWKVTIAGS